MIKDFKEKKLSNGVKVYFYSDKSLKKTFVSYNVNYGTNGFFDKFYYNKKVIEVKPAMAHFLEHLLIETCPKGNMLHLFSNRNYDSNGITYPELTTYFFVGIDSQENIKESIKDLIEMVDKPVFKEENIESVKSAIIEELKGKQDNKYQIANANNRHNTFKNFDAVPVDNNVLGSAATTKKITLEDVKNCYKAYYYDENKFLVIGGNFDEEEMLNWLEEIYHHIKPHYNKYKPYDYGNDFNVRTLKEIIYNENDSDYVIETYKIENKFKEKKLLLSFYIEMYLTLKFKSDMPFVENLIREDIINHGIYYSCDFFHNAITISLSFESHRSEEAIERIEEVLNLDNLDREEFVLIKKSMIVEQLRKRDYIYRCFERLPLNIEFSTHISDIDVIKKLNFDEMINIISRLSFNLKTITILKNKE